MAICRVRVSAPPTPTSWPLGYRAICDSPIVRHCPAIASAPLTKSADRSRTVKPETSTIDSAPLIWHIRVW